jgi:hypothetical protein
MATLPTVPSFDDGDTSILKLQQLSQAVSFLVDCDTHPLWHLYNSATHSGVTTSTWVELGTATNIAWDNDGVSDSGVAEIVTQGYYAVEACVPFESISASNDLYVRFLYTAGSNGTLDSGTTITFGRAGGSAVQSASQDTDICISDIVPACCYPGDTIEVEMYYTSDVTVNYNQNTSYISGRFPFNFTGYLIRTGP